MHIHDVHEWAKARTGRSTATTGRRRGVERDGARARYLDGDDGSSKEAARDAVISGARR